MMVIVMSMRHQLLDSIKQLNEIPTNRIVRNDEDDEKKQQTARILN